MSLAPKTIHDPWGLYDERSSCSALRGEGEDKTLLSSGTYSAGPRILDKKPRRHLPWQFMKDLNKDEAVAEEKLVPASYKLFACFALQPNVRFRIDVTVKWTPSGWVFATVTLHSETRREEETSKEV